MRAVEFRIFGDGLESLVDELARPMQGTLWRRFINACQEDPHSHIIQVHPNVFLVFRELLCWGSSGPVMVTIALNFVSSGECSVLLVSGGGNSMLLMAQERAAQKMMKAIRQICLLHSWSLSEANVIKLDKTDIGNSIFEARLRR